MTTSDIEKVKEKVKEILNEEYERMHPFEIEKKLGKLWEQFQGDEEIKGIFIWEFALLNRTFGHTGEYKGERVNEISNKWESILLNREDIKAGGRVDHSILREQPEDSGMFLHPLKNIPFCEWDIKAIEYYEKRYEEASSQLSKARYAFAIAVLRKEKREEHFEWFGKSINSWLAVAEKYIDEGVYAKDYYDVPSFSYKFSLKLALCLNQKELAEKILNSLHQKIIQIIRSGEDRWYLEYLEIESDFINRLKVFEKEKLESMKEIEGIIRKLEATPFSQSKYHFIRHHIRILLKYNMERIYDWDKRIAETYITEAEDREEHLLKSSFYTDAIKHYKRMQGKYNNKVQKEEISKKIDEITLKIKESTKKTKYSELRIETSIKNEDIKKIVGILKRGNIFENLLENEFITPNYNQTTKTTEAIKKEHLLPFIIPRVISREDAPKIKYSSERELFDHSVRQNILIGIKIGGIMLKMTIEELKKDSNINTFEEVEKLLSGTKELADIEEILRRGFYHVFGELEDQIAGIHILIPYFEEILRKIIVKAGKRDLVLETENQKFFRSIELGGLLQNKDVKDVIGEDLQNTLNVLLCANDQANTRNNLTHGLLKSNQINGADVSYIAYCLLKLIKILRDSKLKEDN